MVLSERPGLGKSRWKKVYCNKVLYVEGVRCLEGDDVTIPIHQEVNIDLIVARLYKDLGYDYVGDKSNTIHIDISHKVS